MTPGYNLDEPHKHDAECKKLVAKGHVLHDSSYRYEIPRVVQLLENRMVVARD